MRYDPEKKKRELEALLRRAHEEREERRRDQTRKFKEALREANEKRRQV